MGVCFIKAFAGVGNIHHSLALSNPHLKIAKVTILFLFFKPYIRCLTHTHTHSIAISLLTLSFVVPAIAHTYSSYLYNLSLSIYLTLSLMGVSRSLLFLSLQPILCSNSLSHTLILSLSISRCVAHTTSLSLCLVGVSWIPLGSQSRLKSQAISVLRFQTLVIVSFQSHLGGSPVVNVIKLFYRRKLR